MTALRLRQAQAAALGSRTLQQWQARAAQLGLHRKLLRLLQRSAHREAACAHSTRKQAGYQSLTRMMRRRAAVDSHQAASMQRRQCNAGCVQVGRAPTRPHAARLAYRICLAAQTLRAADLVQRPLASRRQRAVLGHADMEQQMQMLPHLAVQGQTQPVRAPVSCAVLPHARTVHHVQLKLARVNQGLMLQTLTTANSLRLAAPWVASAAHTLQRLRRSMSSCL